jgi:DNA-binding response OmpR family regulator
MRFGSMNATPATMQKGSMKAVVGTALILDDSPILAQQLRLLLQQCGFTVVVATAPVDTKALPQPLALICIELLQETANGFQLLRQLSNNVSCPLLLLSGTSRSSDVQWGLRAGAAAVLTRPLTAAALEQCLRQLGCCGSTLE